MSEDEWGFWMEGKAAKGDIVSPTGAKLASAGEKRDGGSYEDRMGGVACWNATMDENNIWFVSGTKWLQLRKRYLCLSKGQSFTAPLRLKKKNAVSIG